MIDKKEDEEFKEEFKVEEEPQDQIVNKPPLRIKHDHRKKLKYYLQEFYSHFPHEKYTIFHFVRFFKHRLKSNRDAWIGVSGSTGCQPKGSKVLLANGEWKNIEKIKVGDRVLSPQKDGTNIFSTVLKTFNFFSKDTYDIRESQRKKAHLYSCSYNHEFPIYRRTTPKKNRVKGNFKSFWSIQDYRADNYAALSDTTINHNLIGFSSFPISSFENRSNCEIEPYSLGVYIGDGMFRGYQGKYGISKQLNITIPDKEVMEEIGKYYPWMNIKERDGCDVYYYSVTGKFAVALEKYGLYNKKSGDKFIPKEALLSDLEYRKRLFAGLADSDGHNGKGSTGYDFVFKSKKLVEDIRFLAYSLGYRTRITECEKGIKSTGFKGKYYRMYVYVGNDDIPVLTKRRKITTNQHRISTNRTAIKSIKNEGKEVFGFMLDSPSHYYITDNFMVTKNSGKSLFVLMSMILFGRPMTMQDNIAYIPKGMEIVEKFRKLQFQTFLIDEAAREMRAVNWQSKQQQAVNLQAMTERFKNNMVFLNMPNFSEFTKSMRMGNLQFRVIVAYRNDKFARIILQRKSRNWRADDPWGDELANTLYARDEKRHKEISNESILKIERNLPSTVMDFIVPNLELILPEVTDEYERLKLLSREIADIEEKKLPTKNVWKEKYQVMMAKVSKILMYNDLGLGTIKVNKGDIANALGVTPKVFNEYLDKQPDEFLKKSKNPRHTGANSK